MTKRPSDPHKQMLITLDKRYRFWLSFQPSCIGGGYSEIDDQGRPRCVAAHIRRSSNAGVAYKPMFSAVPMMQTQHLAQHQHGESALHSPEWFEEKAAEYLERWLAHQDDETREIVNAALY